jgi:hypothetical protein
MTTETTTAPRYEVRDLNAYAWGKSGHHTYYWVVWDNETNEGEWFPSHREAKQAASERNK